MSLAHSCITTAQLITITMMGTYVAADERLFQQRSGSKVCVGAICPDGSAFHYYDCCGALYNECCFRLQTWLIVVLTIVGVLILASVIISVIRCIFCCN